MQRKSEKHGIGFGADDFNADASTLAVKKFFRPEFRNRLDNIIKFNSLDSSIVKKIVLKFINEVNELLGDKQLTLKPTDKALEQLAKISYDPAMGARPVKRMVEQKIKIPFSKIVIKENIKPKTTVNIDYNDNEFVFNYAK